MRTFVLVEDDDDATVRARPPSTKAGLTSDDVEALVVRAQGGERLAFESLVRLHQRAVYGVCLRYLRDADEAKDLVQKTFVRAMGSLAELRTPATFRTWLLRVAVNLALNHRRDHARFVRSEDGDLETSDVATGDLPIHHARLESSERAAALRTLVSTLPTKQRLTLELRIYDDLAFKDIAEILQISEGAAKVNFHYAVRRLRHLIGPGASAHSSGDDPERPRSTGGDDADAP